MKKYFSFLILTFSILAAVPDSAQAGRKSASAEMRNTLTERARQICREVLPSWIKSTSGMRNKSVRRLVADCYLEQAKLPSLGVRTVLFDRAIIMNEVPVMLLEKETGLHFDLYAPIAGVELRIRETNTLRETGNE